jgi:anti-anti-sigma factor
MALAETGPFTVTTSRALGRVVLTLRGELDVATGPALSTTLKDIIEEQGNLDVIIDLARLEFVDSAGLSVLLCADRKLKERGGTLTLSAPRPHVRKVLEIMGLTQVLTLIDS